MQKTGWFVAVRGHSRSSAMSPFDRAHTTSYSTLIETMGLSCRPTVFRDIASYLSKVADFDPPHLHLAPPQGVIPVEFRWDLWQQKTRVPGLSCTDWSSTNRPSFAAANQVVTLPRVTDHSYVIAITIGRYFLLILHVHVVSNCPRSWTWLFIVYITLTFISVLSPCRYILAVLRSCVLSTFVPISECEYDDDDVFGDVKVWSLTVWLLFLSCVTLSLVSFFPLLSALEVFFDSTAL